MIRFIPALAGNSRAVMCHSISPSVHPRACGEQISGRYLQLRFSGSSPRLRGTDVDDLVGLPLSRFIPALAGNSSVDWPECFPSAVHPRACGEQLLRHRGDFDEAGSSPRLRGTDPAGSEPVRQHRFIPALAGNRQDSVSGSLADAVHPRACGEQQRCAAGQIELVGSSPRLRGTAAQCSRSDRDGRFIPALAGNSGLRA